MRDQLPAPARNGHRLARHVAAVAFFATLAFAMPWAHASEQPRSTTPEDGAALDPGAPAPAIVGQLKKPAPDATNNFWVWSAGGRGFFLDNPGFDSANNTPYRYIVAVDLETGAQVDRQRLPFDGYRDLTNGNSNNLRIDELLVDEANGRLFVLEQVDLVSSSFGTAGDALNGKGASGNHFGGPVNAAASGNVCTAEGRCITAVWEVDATTLQAVKRIPLPQLRAEGAMVSPQLVALSYSPPRAAEGGKIHVLLMDAKSEHAIGNNPRTLTSTETVYLVQLDIASGVAEWTYRVDACRASRVPSSSETQTIGPIRSRARAGAIMRDPRPDKPYLYVACHTGGNAGTAALVRIPLDPDGNPPSLPVSVSPGAATTGGGTPAPAALAGPSAQPDVFLGPEKAYEVYADPASGRILMLVVDGAPVAQVVWVFDALNWRLLGTIGLGPASGTMDDSLTGIDLVNGRMYVLNAETQGRPGGLYLADFRRTPLAQALRFDAFNHLARTGNLVASLVTWPGGDGRLTRVYIPNNTGASVRSMTTWTVLVDPIARSTDPAMAEERRSLDLDEVDGVTSASLDGAARGYGARALLIGGAEAASRVGPVDVIGNVLQWQKVLDADAFMIGNAWDQAGNPRLPCGAVNREVVLGVVGPTGPAVVDGSGARGGAEPVVTDSSTAADGEALVSRCGTVVDAFRDWDSVWGTALFGRAPLEEPSAPALTGNRGVQCVSSDQQADAAGDPVMDGFAAAVHCEDEEASGFAYARGFGTGLSGIAEALSSFRIYRDPARGVVSRVESVARGIGITGVLRIDTVRGTGESWANGRSQPVAESERDASYDPNCDFERSAGTCYRRHVFGVWTPGYQCGPCGDERTMVERMNRSISSYGSVRLREPNPELARGSEDGFTAAIQKPDAERFADLVLNNDLLQTVVPTLEIIRYAPPNRAYTRGGPRGRQVYQLAGVEVSSSYAIQCLLIYDEAANTCAAAKEPPGSITINLVDGAGRALAGGAFEVRRDTDADGVAGLADALLPNGACVTADDGTGACRFEGLEPASYLVTQVAAPSGYGRIEEPFKIDLASGEAHTVTFTNTSDVSVVEVQATDADGGPLAGASFAVYADPDADGKVAPDSKPAAQCTTDATGTCAMRVPAGSYVLAQTAAPDGLEAIQPVPFTFASGGQTAAVGIVNYPPDQAGAAPSPAASPVEYRAPSPPPVSESVDLYEPTGPSAAEPRVSLPEAMGGTIVRVIRAPGDALRLLSRDPVQALAWTTSLALFALSMMAVRRRALLGGLVLAAAGPRHGDCATPPRPPADGPPHETSEARPSTSGGASGGHAKGDHASGGHASGGHATAGGVTSSRATSAARAGRGTGIVAADIRVAVASGSELSAMIVERLAQAPDCVLMAEVRGLEDLRSALQRRAADVCVVDLSEHSPDELLSELGDLHAAARIVGVVSDSADPELVRRGFLAGLGSLLAIEDLENGQLRYVVRKVASGKRCYGPTVQTVLADCFARSLEPATVEPVPYLTERELEIARMAAQGLRREIARRLVISEPTVKTHLKRVRTKLGMQNPRDYRALRKRLEELGLLEDPRSEEQTGSGDAPEA